MPLCVILSCRTALLTKILRTKTKSGSQVEHQKVCNRILRQRRKNSAAQAQENLQKDFKPISQAIGNTKAAQHCMFRFYKMHVEPHGDNECISHSDAQLHGLADP